MADTIDKKREMVEESDRWGIMTSSESKWLHKRRFYMKKIERERGQLKCDF